MESGGGEERPLHRSSTAMAEVLEAHASGSVTPKGRFFGGWVENHLRVRCSRREGPAGELRTRTMVQRRLQEKTLRKGPVVEESA